VRETTLSGKTAIVTGGSRGIGFAIARALVDRDATVVIAGTHEGRLETAARALEDANANAMVDTIRADVRRYPDVELLMNTTVQRFGGIDILVNNAGVGIWRSVEQMSVAEWHEIVDTNLTGVFYCCRAALPHLKQRGNAWIVNISSLAGAFADGAAYCASKAGLNAFTESLMQEVRHDGVRVACVAPGSVRTGFSGRSQENADWKLAPEDVAAAVVDLITYPERSLPSRVELRPARPPKKG